MFMEPVTHLLTGAVLARTGFNRRAAYATLAMAIAAELPDLDMVRIWIGPEAGPLTNFEHHRGITHTLVAAPLEALLLTGIFYLGHRLVKRKQTPTKTLAPANWPLLYGGMLLALLSHLLLDWTNNYGLRPFFPFDPHWYAGSFVFIFEPILFLLLLAPLILPSLFALVNSEVGSRKRDFPSPNWAWLALSLIAVLYLYRYNEHTRALALASQTAPAGATRFFASPYLVTPWKWAVITDTPDAYHLSTIDTRTGETDPPRPSDTVYKLSPDLPLLAAKRSTLGRAYLDWSSFPILTEQTDNSDPHHPLAAVTFSDARYLYNVVPTATSNGSVSLSGTVLLDMQAPEGQRVVQTTFGGKPQN